MFRSVIDAIVIGTAIGLFLLLSSFPVEATDCDKHPIFCQIKKNSPKINNKKAMDLSNVIYKVTKKYDISSNILTAIFAQESAYNIGAENCMTGLEKSALKEGKMVETTVCFDFGIGQINWKNVKNRKWDIVRLMSDYDYSVESAAIVLSEFKNRFKKWDETYWTRYNARNTIKRELYRKLVERYLNEPTHLD